MSRSDIFRSGVLVLLLGVLLAGVCFPARAQDATTIRFGDKLIGEITASAPVVTYRLESNLRQTLDLTVAAVDGTFIPHVRVFVPANDLIAEINNVDGAPSVSAVVPLPEPNVYFIDIEGRRGATGAFIITARLGPSVPGAVELDAGDVLTGAVSEASPGVVYDLNSAVDGNLYLMVRGHTPNASPDVALWATIPDQLAGNGSGLLDGVAFIITRGDAPYSLRVTYGGSGGEEHYTICLMRLADAAGCLGDFRASGPT